MRRRRGVRQARERWVQGPWGRAARAINSQAGMAAITPRARRVAELLALGPETRYLDIGCGTSGYAHLLAEHAGVERMPVCVDLAIPTATVDLFAWPEALPFPDESFDAISSLYFLRRLDDTVVHNFAAEVRRVLAPGGAALFMEIAPVKATWLNRLHARVVSPGCEQVDLRGWRRLAAMMTDVGFDELTLVNAGPFLFPPIPRVAILARRGPAA